MRAEILMIFANLQIVYTRLAQFELPTYFFHPLHLPISKSGSAKATSVEWTVVSEVWVCWPRCKIRMLKDCSRFRTRWRSWCLAGSPTLSSSTSPMTLSTPSTRTRTGRGSRARWNPLSHFVWKICMAARHRLLTLLLITDPNVLINFLSKYILTCSSSIPPPPLRAWTGLSTQTEETRTELSIISTPGCSGQKIRSGVKIKQNSGECWERGMVIGDKHTWH